MKRRPRPQSRRRRAPRAPRNHDPRIVDFLAAVLRQFDHAADLVVAFLRSLGLQGSNQTTVVALPREFLLELAALLQLREWHAGGLIDPAGPSIDDRIGAAIERFRVDPMAVAQGKRGTAAMIDVVRTWTETCAPDARSHLAADIAIRWDDSVVLDSVVDAFASFLCRHRDAGLSTEFT